MRIQAKQGRRAFKKSQDSSTLSKVCTITEEIHGACPSLLKKMTLGSSGLPECKKARGNQGLVSRHPGVDHSHTKGGT